MRGLLAELHRTLEAGRDCVFCSVVETRGSTPQKAGAAMLVFPDGRQVGTLGGGCVEAEVKRQALKTLAGDDAGKTELLSFCLDDNYGWDDGLICGGRMSILADPLMKNSERRQHLHQYYKRFHSVVESGQGCTEAVTVSPEVGPVGGRFLFDAKGVPIDQLAGIPAPPMVREGLIPLERRPKAWHQHGVAYLPFLPRVTLLIVGGGHVGQAVAKLAADLDFESWVLDDREAYANVQRFPTSCRHIVGDIGQTLRSLLPEITSSVYTLIVTRGHGHDEEALYHLATSNAGYVGMIGSKRKIKLIYDDLIARAIPADALGKVHAPLGFDIGSQTVPEIAVSILAELIAVRNRGETISSARIQVRAV